MRPLAFMSDVLVNSSNRTKTSGGRALVRYILTSFSFANTTSEMGGENRKRQAKTSGAGIRTVRKDLASLVRA